MVTIPADPLEPLDPALLCHNCGFSSRAGWGRSCPQCHQAGKLRWGKEWDTANNMPTVPQASAGPPIDEKPCQKCGKTKPVYEWCQECFPHQCPSCGCPAYVGLQKVECPTCELNDSFEEVWYPGTTVTWTRPPR